MQQVTRRTTVDGPLRRLHDPGDLGLVHGDVTQYNFLIEGDHRGCVRLVDFEHAQDYDEKLAQAELKSLPAELTKQTGHGSSTTRMVIEA